MRLCSVMKHVAKYEQGAGVGIANLELLSLSLPSETAMRNHNRGKTVKSFLHQYVLRNRINTNLKNL